MDETVSNNSTLDTRIPIDVQQPGGSQQQPHSELELQPQRQRQLEQEPQQQPLYETREDYLKYGVGLYKAALVGNWEEAKRIKTIHDTCFEQGITANNDTALHVAALAGHTKFALNLIEEMTDSALVLINKEGNTALCHAAASGNVPIAMRIVERNRNQETMEGTTVMKPLLMAATLGNRKMVTFLLNHTNYQTLSDSQRSALFFAYIRSGLYDRALDMVQMEDRRYRGLAVLRENINEPGDAQQSDAVQTSGEVPGDAQQSDAAQTSDEGPGNAQQSDAVQTFGEVSGDAQQSDAGQTSDEGPGDAQQSDAAQTSGEGPGDAQQSDAMQTSGNGLGDAQQSDATQTSGDGPWDAQQSDAVQTSGNGLGDAQQSDAAQTSGDGPGDAQQSDEVPGAAQPSGEGPEDEQQSDATQTSGDGSGDAQQSDAEQTSSDGPGGAQQSGEVPGAAQQPETPLHAMALMSLGRNTCSSKDAEAVDLVKFIYNEVLLIQDQEVVAKELMDKPWPILFEAVKMGNYKFVTTLLDANPELIWCFNNKKENRSVIHEAIVYRQEKIFSMMYEIGSVKNFLAMYVDATDKSNMLHLAAKLPPPDRLNTITGAALQMNREVRWFELVKDLLPPHLAEAQNNDRQTPADLFSLQHKELRKEAESWMKRSATSGSIVATLIASVLFTGNIVLIGREKWEFHNVVDNGIKDWGFAICDMVSVITSIAAVLLFLSILNSRYKEKDFLTSLPLKLMLGLLFTFISISTMMGTYAIAFSLIFKSMGLWITNAALAFILICIYGCMELPLFWDFFTSTVLCERCKRRSKVFQLTLSQNNTGVEPSPAVPNNTGVDPSPAAQNNNGVNSSPAVQTNPTEGAFQRYMRNISAFLKCFRRAQQHNPLSDNS